MPLKSGSSHQENLRPYKPEEEGYISLLAQISLMINQATEVQKHLLKTEETDDNKVQLCKILTGPTRVAIEALHRKYSPKIRTGLYRSYHATLPGWSTVSLTGL